MRVLQIIPTLGPASGGAGVACMELSRTLAQQGIDVSIYAFARDLPTGISAEAANPITVDGVSINLFPAFGPQKYPVSPPLFAALARNIRRFDVVHIHSLYRFHIAVAAWLCRKHGVPYIVKPHGSLSPPLFGQRRWMKVLHERLIDRPAYMHAAAIQFTAQDEMDFAKGSGFFDDDEVTSGVIVPTGVVIPEGFSEFLTEGESEEIFARFPELRGKELILYLGRLHPKKGLDLVVEAFPQVQARRPNAHLVIAGPDVEDHERTVREWLKARGLSDKATFTGMVRGPEKSRLLALASVFALPSYSENFGIAIVEAMSVGLPVVISNRVNIWRAIESGGAGIITNCDSGEVAQALLRILENPELARDMGRRGRTLASSQFSWPVVTRQMIRLYQSVVATATAPKP